ncbi:ubiquitin homeostasis protein lub1-like isoform X2 [Rutidosis leptorrhynchoides]|uniref:ubiquitin homeostasis protein lub1-like isoform X2 n=1 Tax=Rutidosis leptorrhynchoides TaxID=125765 RepID=UPI003A9957BA
MNIGGIPISPYQLRCQLRGHEDDVRCLCVCNDVGIATSSRDRTIRFWSLEQTSDKAYTLSKILRGHTRGVGPLTWIPPNNQFKKGVLVSGGADELILVWDIATGENIQTFCGHKLPVTGVTLDGSDIISSSIDGNLRRWIGGVHDGNSLRRWTAHVKPIETVRTLRSGKLITGSSDTTIKLWEGNICTHTFTGHTDTVRGLAIMPDERILSASDDCSIRLWTLTGEVEREMLGHKAIVYSVDAHKSEVVSGSEDGLAKIWKDGVCVQSIEHPGRVYDVKFLENGDFVTACSDGVARVWTLNQDMIAETRELDEYASLLSQYKGRSQNIVLTDADPMLYDTIAGDKAGEMKVLKMIKADYMNTVQNGTNPDMRVEVVNSLCKVAQSFRLKSDTLYLAVGYIDRYLSVAPLNSGKYELLGLACIMIAVKIVELPYKVERFLKSHSNQDELHQMEYEVVTILECHLMAPSASSFLETFVGIQTAPGVNVEGNLECFARYICDLSLREYDVNFKGLHQVPTIRVVRVCKSSV